MINKMSKCRAICDWCKKPIMKISYYRKHCGEDDFCSPKCLKERYLDDLEIREKDLIEDDTRIQRKLKMLQNLLYSSSPTTKAMGSFRRGFYMQRHIVVRSHI